MKSIKKLTTLLCSVLCGLSLSACSNLETGSSNSNENPENEIVETKSAIDGFSDWALSGGNAGAYSNSFLGGKENRPSDAELEKILQTANTYFQCHGLTGAHFIVIKDTEEQKNIAPFFGIDNTGTVTILVVSDGIKSQEYHEAQYYPGSTNVNGGNPEYWNMYYGIYESGWASAYLNLAAIEAGYRTRAYAALNIENAMIGAVDPYGTGGNFEYITTENWNIEKYMHSKDGKESFDHYVAALDDTIPLEGNVTLLCVIVIGKVDEIDTTTSTTVKENYKMGMRGKYDFWDKEYNEDNQSATSSSATTDASSGATKTE